MKKRHYLIAFAIILGVLVSETNAQTGIQIDCYGSLKAYELDPNMRNYTCTCPNGRHGKPVCRPRSSSGSYAPSARLSPSQQMAVGIAGALLNNLFSNMFNEMFNPPPSGNSYQEQLRIQQEEKRQQEMRAALDAWRDAQERATQDALKEQQRKKEQGASLISKMDGGLTGGGGKLDPMWITQKPELLPLQLGGHPTSRFKLGDRLLCSSYFSTRAIEETRKGNYEGARFFSEQADKVMVKAETDVECKFPQMPNVPTPKTKGMDPKKFTALMEGFNTKIKELQNVEADLNKARREKQAAEENLKKIDEKIAELDNQAQSAQNPEEKAQADDLIRQALALKSEAEDQANTAKQNEQELLDKAKNMAKDMDASLKSVQ